MIDENGKLTEPIIQLLNVALDYEIQPMRESTWSYYKDTKFGRFWFFITGNPSATVSGTDVYYDNGGRHDLSWLGLIAHEESHRQEVFEQGNWNFYVKYLGEGARKNYREISSEKKAYKFGLDRYNDNDMIDQLLRFSRGKVMATLRSQNLTDFEKITILKDIGIKFKVNVVLPNQIKSIDKGIKKLENEVQNFDGTSQELEIKQNVLNLGKSIKDALVKELKKMQKEISKGKNELKDKGSSKDKQKKPSKQKSAARFN